MNKESKTRKFLSWTNLLCLSSVSWALISYWYITFSPRATPGASGQSWKHLSVYPSHPILLPTPRAPTAQE